MEKNRNSCGGNTAHDQLNHHLREVKSFEDFMNEALFNMIIGLSEVHFNCHEPDSPFFIV